MEIETKLNTMTSSMAPPRPPGELTVWSPRGLYLRAPWRWGSAAGQRSDTRVSKSTLTAFLGRRIRGSETLCNLPGTTQRGNFKPFCLHPKPACRPHLPTLLCGMRFGRTRGCGLQPYGELVSDTAVIPGWEHVEVKGPSALRPPVGRGTRLRGKFVGEEVSRKEMASVLRPQVWSQTDLCPPLSGGARGEGQHISKRQLCPL